jgi:hypothetical protein
MINSGKMIIFALVAVAICRAIFFANLNGGTAEAISARRIDA